MATAVRVLRRRGVMGHRVEEGVMEEEGRNMGGAGLRGAMRRHESRGPRDRVMSVEIHVVMKGRGSAGARAWMWEAGAIRTNGSGVSNGCYRVDAIPCHEEMRAGRCQDQHKMFSTVKGERLRYEIARHIRSYWRIPIRIQFTTFTHQRHQDCEDSGQGGFY